MNINKLSLQNNPYIGLFCSTNDKITLVPSLSTAKEINIIRDMLGTEVIKTRVCGTYLIGVFVRGNSKNFVIGDALSEDEKQKLKDLGLKLVEIPSNLNAFGNLIACNDKAAIIAPELKDKKKQIEKALDVKAKEMIIAGLNIVGSCLTVTNKGFVVNPNISEKDFKGLEKLFGVKGIVSTANYGDRFVSHSVLANSNGAVVGTLTTSPEIIHITEGLNL
ncbi:MAG: translation initiation factor IF-6 [Candidatus Diapherotrites archaeon]|nr:translation initiation factor IF-6 [Candidatus Diapherotrites archaeon]